MFNNLSFKLFYSFIAFGMFNTMTYAAEIKTRAASGECRSSKIEQLLSANHAGAAPFIIIDAKDQTLYLFGE